MIYAKAAAVTTLIMSPVICIALLSAQGMLILSVVIVWGLMSVMIWFTFEAQAVRRGN